MFPPAQFQAAPTRIPTSFVDAGPHPRGAVQIGVQTPSSDETPRRWRKTDRNPPSKQPSSSGENVAEGDEAGRAGGFPVLGLIPAFSVDETRSRHSLQRVGERLIALEAKRQWGGVGDFCAWRQGSHSLLPFDTKHGRGSGTTVCFAVANASGIGR